MPAATSGTAAATSTSPEVVIVTSFPLTTVTTPTTSAFAAEFARAFANAPLEPLDLTTFPTAKP